MDIRNLIPYCIEGNLEEIKKLNLNLEYIQSYGFASPLEIIKSKNNAALIWTSYNGHLQVVKYLIEQGLTLEDIRSSNNCAFIGASIYGHLEVVKYLINKGLTLEDIRSLDNYALRKTSENGHLEVVKYLCEFKDEQRLGLTLEDIKSQGNCAIRSAYLNEHIDVVKYLEETIKILKAKEEHKKEWDYICGEIVYKPELGIEYFKHLEDFIK